MQTVLVLHNLLRWLVLLFGLWTLINAITGLSAKRAYTASDNRSNLLFMIFCDIQLLLGLILYFNNQWFGKLTDNMKAAMQDAATRFFSLEHGLMMIIAWVLVHIGRSAVKRATTDRSKHKKMLIFFGLALFLILASIPWSFRQEIARPLFRGF
jgi:hypothetical protein